MVRFEYLYGTMEQTGKAANFAKQPVISGMAYSLRFALDFVGFCTIPSMLVPPLRLRPVALLLGDSLTQLGFGDSTDIKFGWASLLAAAYSRRCDILNRGFSGYNTGHILEQVLPNVFTTDSSAVPSILFCTIWLGANDAALPGEPQHVPLSAYKTNMETIVRSVRSKVGEKTPIVLLTPPPVDETMWATHLEAKHSDRRNDVTRQYCDCVLQIAEDSGKYCVAVDVWKLLSGDDIRQYLSDGVHLSEDGNFRVYTALMDKIASAFPHIAPMVDDGPEGVPVEGKPWRDLC